MKWNSFTMERIMQHWNFLIIFICALNCVKHLWFNFGKSKLCSPNVPFPIVFWHIFLEFQSKNVYTKYVCDNYWQWICVYHSNQRERKKNWAFLSLSYFFVEIRNHDCVQFNKHTNYTLELFSSEVETARERQKKTLWQNDNRKKKLNFRIAANAIIKSEY